MVGGGGITRVRTSSESTATMMVTPSGTCTPSAASVAAGSASSLDLKASSYQHVVMTFCMGFSCSAMVLSSREGASGNSNMPPVAPSMEHPPPAVRRGRRAAKSAFLASPATDSTANLARACEIPRTGAALW